jgi:hypothetical protein
MTAQVPHGTGITAGALIVLGLLLLAPASSSAATTPIYKCLDKNLGLLYTDQPCKDGELLDIRAGDADPAAVARLERARDALDQSAAQRIADERRAAAQRDLAAAYAGGVEPSPYDYTANMPYDYGVGWGYPGFGRHHPPRSRPHRPMEPRRLALVPPQMAPRR